MWEAKGEERGIMVVVRFGTSSRGALTRNCLR
jgi:hypothetical protein